MFHKNLTGADLHAPSNQIVENQTGTVIPALTCVTYDGIGASFPSVSPANGLTQRIYGIAQDDIAIMGVGYITALGFMINLDTSAWPPLTSLYSDPYGTLSLTPNGPAVASVIKQDATVGVLYVHMASEGSGGGGGSGDVIGPASSLDNAISRFDGTSGKLIQNSKALLQDGGGIQTQAIMVNRSIADTVVVNSNYSMISSEIEIENGEIQIEADGEVVII